MELRRFPAPRSANVINWFTRFFYQCIYIASYMTKTVANPGFPMLIDKGGGALNYYLA